MDRAQALSGPGLATADDCDDGEEVSRVRLRYPKHLMSCTIALAHTLTPSHTVRCLDRDTDTAGDCIGRAGLSGVWLRNPKHPGVHAGAGVCALTSSRRGPTGGVSIGNEYSIQRPDSESSSSFYSQPIRLSAIESSSRCQTRKPVNCKNL